MGIGKFSEFLKKRAPNCYYEVPLESFRGHRVSIDMNNLNYPMMSSSTKRQVDETDVASQDPDQASIQQRAIEMILNRLEIFLQYGITPVCVFDGKPHPLKNHGREKKAKKVNDIRVKFEAAKQRLRAADFFAQNQGLINEYLKYVVQNVHVPHEFGFRLQDILKSVGFPVICANDIPIICKDAEGICASLCLNGYCVAGFTTDSDFHAYGGVNQIVEIVHRASGHYAKIRSLEAILQESKLTFHQFVDLCILLGNDFNPNIPKVGLVNAFKKLTLYGSIQQMSCYEDVSILNHEKVREMFTSTLVKMDLDLQFDMEKFRTHARDIFSLNGLHDHTGKIHMLLEEMRPKFVVVQ